MAILVTGGAGYIGSHTCVSLLEAGYEAVVLDNLSNSSEKALERVKEITGKSVKFYKCDILDKGTLCLLDVMIEANVKKMVFSSSATVYGITDKVPLTEDLPTSANSPYGQTKLMIEQILRDLSVSDHEWSISLLRYFNPVGAHKSGKIGENPKGIHALYNAGCLRKA